MSDFGRFGGEDSSNDCCAGICGYLQQISTRCLLIVVVVVVALLSIVAIIIAAVSLGGNKQPAVNYNIPPAGGGTGGNEQPNIIVNVNKDGETEEKTWMIAIGHDFGAQEYIDDDGYIKGIQMDIILEVCEAAGMVCRTVWEPYNNCYDSEPGQHSFGGKGLLGGWYDACCGWVNTVGRSAIFDFSMPFLKDELQYFLIKKGTSFDLEKATKIGFLDGWNSDEKCLARSGLKGSKLTVGQVVHFNSPEQLIDAVSKGQVDAGFGPMPLIEGTDLEASGSGVTCSLSGSAMMTRKDNEFNMNWNKGWQVIKNNGVYRRICDEAKATHGKDRKLLECYT